MSTYVIAWSGATDAVSGPSSGIPDSVSPNHLVHEVGAPLYYAGQLSAWGAAGLVSLGPCPNPAPGETGIAYAVSGDSIAVVTQSGDGSSPTLRLQVFTPVPPKFSLAGHTSTVRFS